MASVAATGTPRDVRRVKAHDRDFDAHGTVLAARMKAVLDAQRAVAERELGAGYALRQSLVDLAAVSEALADELPLTPEIGITRPATKNGGGPKWRSRSTASTVVVAEAADRLGRRDTPEFIERTWGPTGRRSYDHDTCSPDRP